MRAVLSAAWGETPAVPPSPAPRGVRLRSSAALAKGKGLICTDKVESLCFSAIKQLRSFYTQVLSGLMCLVEQEKKSRQFGWQSSQRAAGPHLEPGPAGVPARGRRGCPCVDEAWSFPAAPGAGAQLGARTHCRAPHAKLRIQL